MAKKKKKETTIVDVGMHITPDAAARLLSGHHGLKIENIVPHGVDEDGFANSVSGDFITDTVRISQSDSKKGLATLEFGTFMFGTFVSENSDLTFLPILRAEIPWPTSKKDVIIGLSPITEIKTTVTLT